MPSYTAPVDAHALSVLEYAAIVERLARSTATPAGTALAFAHQPSSDPEEVRRRQQLTAEAIALYDHAAEPSLGGIEDVRDAAARAARGAVLAPDACTPLRSACEWRSPLEPRSKPSPN